MSKAMKTQNPPKKKPIQVQQEEPKDLKDQEELYEMMGNQWASKTALESPDLASSDQSLLNEVGFSGHGMQLPFQQEMENEFGMDLSAVRAMQGNGQGMENLQASAFATGDMVAFDSSNPQREQVREEVIHVLQQGRGQGRGVSSPTSASERYAKSGRDAGVGSDASLHRDEADQEAKPIDLSMQAGKTYVVSTADMANGEEAAWKTIARAHAMMPSNLMMFNQHVMSVSQDASANILSQASNLAEGVQLYVPSADELAFAECKRRAGSEEEAMQLYGQLKDGTNLEILRAARFRATGRRGESYGNKGLGSGDKAGPFLTPNPELAGAKPSRSEMLDGQQEYRVNWNATHAGFWKCSLFLHDVVYQAGYQPHKTGNDHYQLAGRLHQSNLVEEISVDKAGPGALWQRFGGTKSDESHNAILTSFVDVTSEDNDKEMWKFKILGAEMDRAAESERSHLMKKGTNETTSGKFIRFFKPSNKR